VGDCLRLSLFCGANHEMRGCAIRTQINRRRPVCPPVSEGRQLHFLATLGLLGGVQHNSEQDLTTTIFVLGGFGFVVLGLVLRSWNWIRSRLSQSGA
jgi:hypothetical protein